MMIFKLGKLVLNYRLGSVRDTLGLSLRNSCFCQYVHSQTTLYWHVPCAQIVLATSIPCELINRYGDITLQIPIAPSPKLTAP